MATYFWVGGNGTWDASATANWALTSGGLPGVTAPNSADTVIFDSNSGTSAVVTVTATAACLTCTVNKSDITLALSGSATLSGASSGTFTLTAGTLSLGSYTLSLWIFSSSNSNARTINFGTGKISLAGNATTIWSCGTTTNLIISGTPIIDFTYAGSTGTRTINHSNQGGGSEAISVSVNILGGSDTVTIASSVNASIKNLNFTGFSGSLTNGARSIYGNLVISSGMTLSAGTSTTTFAGASATQNITTNSKTLDFPLTFNGVSSTFAFQDALTQGSTRAFTITNGTVQLKNGVTSTVGAFATSSTNQKFLQSTLAGSQATLSQASGTVSASNLTIQDINATGGATWNSLWSNNNVDAGNNTGWVFGDPPITLATEYTYALRSFTQPRRF